MVKTSKDYRKSDFKLFIDYKTRWKDMDCIGHVNNATFLTFVESARLELVQKWGYENVPIIMASIKIDYLQQLKHPADLEIGQSVSRIGNTSFDILTGIFKKSDDFPITISTTTLVCFDYKTQKPIKVHREILDFEKD